MLTGLVCCSAVGPAPTPTLIKQRFPKPKVTGSSPVGTASDYKGLRLKGPTQFSQEPLGVTRGVTRTRRRSPTRRRGPASSQLYQYFLSVAANLQRCALRFRA